MARKRTAKWPPKGTEVVVAPAPDLRLPTSPPHSSCELSPSSSWQHLRAAEWKASGSLQAFAGFGVRAAAIASTLDLLQQPRMGASRSAAGRKILQKEGGGENWQREREREREKKEN